MIRIRSIGLLALFIVSLYGCATTPTHQKETLLYWPMPPEEPRIAYVKSCRGAVDFQKLNIFDKLFGAKPEAGLQKPYGVFALGEKIYVTDTGRNQLTVLDFQMRKATSVGAQHMGQLDVPIGAAAAQDGTIFVSDAKLGTVFVYDAAGEFKTAIGKKGELSRPAGIAINNMLSRLYIVDIALHTVRVYTTKGEFLFEFGKRGAADGEFNAPTNIAINRKNGNVYVVDTNNFRVQIFDKDGKFLKKFGEIGDSAGTFSRPKGIGVDSEGHVYVVDAAFNNFQVFDENGQILLSVGNLGRQVGQFQLPAGLYIDETDRIYVSDSINGRVQVFQYLSEAWKKENPEEYNKYLPKY